MDHTPLTRVSSLLALGSSPPRRAGWVALAALVAACGGQTGDPLPQGSPPFDPPRDERSATPPTPPSSCAECPEAFAEGIGGPSALAMTGDQVLFATRWTLLGGARVDAGALFVADKRAGRPLMIALDRQGAAFDALATDGARAFLATSDARLLAVPVAGGAMDVLATLDARAAVVAVAGDHLYFATEAGAVGRVAKSGGAIEPLGRVDAAVRGIEADDAAVYVAVAASSPTPAGIVRLPLDGSDVTTLGALGASEPCAMVRDGRRLFVTSVNVAGASTTDPASGAVLRLSIDGGDVATVASGSFAACAIASDAESLFFATTVPGLVPVRAGGSASVGLGLMRAPIGGGDPVAIAGAAGALAQPGAVAVDARHVYWLTEGAVRRLAK